MPRIEKFQKGAWHYTCVHQYEKYHKGFWHKLFCRNFKVITYWKDYQPWDKKTYQYPCGYYRIVNRYRKEEDQ